MMLKIIDQRGRYPVVNLSPIFEKTMATCQPRRSQRHGGVTSLDPTTELALAQDDRNILQRLSRVGHSVTPDTSDDAEPQESPGDSALVSVTTDAPRRSQRSHKRSRFMDDEYLSSPLVSRLVSNDIVKVLEQRKNLANEPAVKKRSLKSLSSSETSAKNSPKTTIHSTSPAQKGVSRVVTRRSLGPIVRYPIGTRLNVKYGAVNPQVYEAKVIEVDISPQVPRYRVHYRGWNKSHDSWITKIDVVSIIEKPSSLAKTTSGGDTVKPPTDITPKISAKVFLSDCKLSGSHRGCGNDSKTDAVKEINPGADSQGKKRKQDSEEEEEEEKEDEGEDYGSIRERQTRSGRKKQQCVNSLPFTNENHDGEASQSSSDGNPEEIGDAESDARDEMDGSSMESVVEEGIVGATETAEQEKSEEDGDDESGQVEDGEQGASGMEEENGEEDGEMRSNDEDNGDQDESSGSEDSGRRNDDEDEEDGAEDEEKEEKDDEEAEEEEDGTEERSIDLEDQSAARVVPASDHEEVESCLLSLSNKENETIQDETSILSLDLDQTRNDRKPTVIYDSITTSESSCESDSMEPVFGCDTKTTTTDEFLDEETAHDDVSVSNSNSDDGALPCDSIACNELLPAETDSMRSGGTSSITSDHHHHRPDSSGNTTTTTSSCSQLSQLYDAESTRHFARIPGSPAFRTNFIDLEAELKGLDEVEKEDYILRKMRKIQIEYKHMSSIYNKLTRRSNRASNRKKSRSRRHGSVTVATADTEASPVC